MRDAISYSKILTDEDLMETVPRGSNSYPFHFYNGNTESCKFKGFSLKCRNTHEINSFSTPLNT